VTGIGVTPINNNLVSTEIGTTFSLPPVIEISSPSALSIPSFSDENSTDSDIIPMSPSNILRDVDTADPRWMDEYSMSSLLGHLDELANTSDTCNTPARSNESSSLSIISETSVDYVTKFAELAAAEENGGL
uniref:Uncharacterized protein n=1 Tax=Megaselia scalaris TaxID=36166 RepID=T1GDI8_MEGSC